jgi:hypothetical protein
LAGDGDGERDKDGEGESVDGGPAGFWPALLDRSSSYPKLVVDVFACRASNDSTMALTTIARAPAADADAGAVLLLLLRLRFP